MWLNTHLEDQTVGIHHQGNLSGGSQIITATGTMAFSHRQLAHKRTPYVKNAITTDATKKNSSWIQTIETRVELKIYIMQSNN